MQTGGAFKKMKAQRTPPDYTIMEDDGGMIARLVQDCLSEDFDHAAHHRDRIQQELADMRQFLKQIGEIQKARRSRGTKPSTPQIEERVEVEERDPVHPLLQPNATFHITPSMLRMDEIVGQTPLKDLSQIQLVLMRMPSRELHKLQVSVNHEAQSRAHKDLVKLQQAKNKRDTLEIIYEHARWKPKRRGNA
jgi:hypothetical protein